MSLLMLIKKILFISLLVLALIVILGYLYQYIGTKWDERMYPAPGKLVDVGGFKLHMIDTGNGGPTVILDTGTGCNALTWALVQREIAKFTRVCSYDRAGYGWSDESPNARTSSTIVDELHTLLKNAQVPAPYILVGHSFGGLNMRLFASRYPDEVAGVVLLDSAHEDQDQLLPPMPDNKILPKALLSAAYLGIFRLLNHFPQSYKPYAMLPKDIQTILLAKNATVKQVKTVLKEGENIKESCAQLKNILLGDKPLIVITAGKKLSSSECAMPQDWIDQFNQAWTHMQSDLATKSTQAKHIIAERSGHMIPLEQPEIIVQAVREMVSEYNKSK